MTPDPSGAARRHRPATRLAAAALLEVAAAGVAGHAPAVIPAAAAPPGVRSQEPDLGGVPAGPLRDAARIAAPSIVQISTEITGRLDDLAGGGSRRYDLGFGGTGFFVSADGYVVTAAHVAAPTADQVHADFVDDRIDREHGCSRTTTDSCRSVEERYEPGLMRSTSVADVSVEVHVLTQDLSADDQGQHADLVTSSRSSDRDVAVLKVDAHDAPVLLLRRADVPIGAAIAVEGYPESRQDAPDPLVPTVTVGRVSDLRAGDPGFAAGARVVETDAHVEHGNSGGPGVDDQGQVVGLVSYGPTLGPTYLVSAGDITAVLQKTRADNSLGRADHLWRDGLHALAAGDQGSARQDLTGCAALTAIQVGCRAVAEGLGLEVPPAPDSRTPGAAGGAAESLSAGQAAAWLSGGVLIGLVLGVLCTLAAVGSRRRPPARPPQTWYPGGWGPARPPSGAGRPGIPAPGAWSPPPVWPPPAQPVRPAWQQPAWQQPAWQQPAWQQPAWQQPAWPPPPEYPVVAPPARPVPPPPAPPPPGAVQPPPAPPAPGSVSPPPADVPGGSWGRPPG